MLKITIIGYGKMGRILEQTIASTTNMETVAIAGRIPENDVYAELLTVAACDCLIDFSHQSCIGSVLRYATEHTKPAVICTTGFNSMQEAQIRTAAKKIPIVFSHNMSIGINVLKDVIAHVNKVLGNSFDIELIEKHHNLKEDAPSGTAKMLLSSFHDIDQKTIVYGRNSLSKRTHNEIGVHAVRGGTIVGEHTVIFAGNDEVIEIKHTAMSKRIFVDGAIRAVQFVVQQPAGLYTMEDVLK